MAARQGTTDVIPWSELAVDSRPIGAGGFATVFAANWCGVRVAVKVIDRHACYCHASSCPGEACPVRQSAITREVGLQKMASDPRIVAVYGTTAAPTGIVMECMTESLEQRLHELRQQVRAFPLAHRVQLLVQVAGALGRLHGNVGQWAQSPTGESLVLVHGDIGPKNVLLDGAGTAKISDFGLAALRSGNTGSTMLGGPRNVGNLEYCAPERLTLPGEASGRVTPPVDVFNFGLLVYATLTCLSPWHRLACFSRMLSSVGTITEREREAAKREFYVAVKGGARPDVTLPALRAEMIGDPPGLPADQWILAVAQLMSRCWASASAERPLITEAARTLGILLASIQQHSATNA